MHMSRFFAEEKQRNAEMLYKAAKEAACLSLLKAGKAHMALEKLYVSSMDFQAMKIAKEKWKKKVITLLDG